MSRRRYPPAHLHVGRWAITGVLFARCQVCDKGVGDGCRGPARNWLRAFVRFMGRHRRCGLT